MKNIILILSVLVISVPCLFAIDDAEARCAGQYPCRAPGFPPLSAEIAFRSDIIALGKPVSVSYGMDALEGYDVKNHDNPCGLGLQYLRPNEGIAEYLENSKNKAPFIYEFEVEKYYKSKNDSVPTDMIRVVGIERTKDRQYAQQFSYGYEFAPDLGENLLLYLRHFDEFSFGVNCTIPDVYLIDEIQGSIWGWNEDDFKPDIYPGDVKIPPLKEQESYLRYPNNDGIAPSMFDLIACSLGMEPMYRLYSGSSPFCVTEDSANKIEHRGWAKRFSYFWTFDGTSYKDTENFEIWRKST